MTMPNASAAATTPNGAGSSDSPLLGMTAAAAAFGLLSVMTLFAKLLSAHHHVIEIAFWRNIIAIVPFLAIIAFGRRDILTIHSKPRVLLVRSVVGTLNIMFMFGAFSLLPLADATSLIFTSSLFVPVLGFLFLGEHVGPYRWTAIAIGFIGVLWVAQPGGAEWNVLGVALGLIAAFFNAVLGTMLRLLGRTERPETMTFYFLLIGAVMLVPVMPFIATMPTHDEIGLLIGLGLSGSLMQFLLSTAFKYAPAALASVFSYTQIIWATLFGWAVFGDWPASNILIGAAIIITSSVIVILRERYLARKGRLPRPPVATA